MFGVFANYRFNNRKLTDAERFDMAVKGIVGKRLTFDQLTGKTPDYATCKQLKKSASVKSAVSAINLQLANALTHAGISHASACAPTTLSDPLYPTS